MQGLGGPFPEARSPALGSGDQAALSTTQAHGFPPTSRLPVALGAAPPAWRHHRLHGHSGRLRVLLFQHRQVSSGRPLWGAQWAGGPPLAYQLAVLCWAISAC